MSLSDGPFFLILLCAVLPAGCASSGALEGRVKDLEQQVTDLQKATSDISARVDEVNNSLFILKDRMEAQLSSLEALKRREVPSPASRASQKSSRDSSVPQVYKHALTLYNSQEYQSSLKEFDKILADYPAHALAGNARYWKGECYSSLKEYDRALEEFQKVLKDYPKSNKVPDALLKIGFVYLQLGDKKQAVDYMERVIRDHPYSEASKKAEERLKEITQ